MIYTLTLNPALDYDIYLDKLAENDLNLSKNVKFRAGGKGINVSIMLKNLKKENIALGFVSGFTGDYIINYLNNLGIKNDFIKTNGITRINVKINDTYNETEISGISPNIDEKYIEKLKSFISGLSDNDILILSGSIPDNIEKNIYYTLSKLTKAKVILDTRGNLLKDNICNNILIKPNIKELEIAFNTKIISDIEVYKYASYFIEKGVENVLVSMGNKGAILVKKGKYLKANIPCGKYINSIGSGDSMVAGFIYSYLENLNDVDTLKMSVACGSASAYSYEIADFNSVKKLIDDINIIEVKPNL
ncbi:1-phosphofructokinase family hexose kinase [Oceanivirga miroungae]|uniref:1-phosphofructokinase n=1 Tax=Oceanivirga miroungae TaxID=1130046 RepID=A0A6I8MAF1_9FUSO|nr:1-phosphofructokinase family hexose kinase [Oceanivirga miroungae]VWL85298.1 1-phosphofructokinase [Oceanivirga miroungae]